MVAHLLRIPLVMLCAVPAMAAGAPSDKVAAKPSVEGYLCTFAGKCDGVVTESVSRDAPRTKGFRLARPVADAAPSEATKHAVAQAQPVAPAVHGKPRSGGYGAAPRRPAANIAATGTAMPVGARPRADLMIGFELNSSKLTAEGLMATQVFAKSLLMPELQAKRFLIEGHTDLRGGRALNMDLSRARAKAVVDYLVALGVRPDRLQMRGFGPDVPLPGHSATDPSNRRVEAELVS